MRGFGPLTQFSTTWGRVVVGLVTLSLGCGTALAEGMPRVVYAELPQCVVEPIPYDDLIAAMRIELKDAGVADVRRGTPTALGPADGIVRIRVPCESEVLAAQISLRAQGGGEHVRTVDLSDLPPELRARGVALAVAELIPSVWPELIALQRPTPNEDAAVGPGRVAPGSVAGFPVIEDAFDVEGDVPVEEAEAESEPDAAAEAVQDGDERVVPEGSGPAGLRRRVELGVALEFREFFGQGTVLWGGRPAIGWRRLQVGFDALFGRHDAIEAELNSRILAATVGYFLVDRHRARNRYFVAPRASLGTVSTRSAATPYPTIVREPYLDLALTGGGGLLRGNCTFGAEGEAGIARGFVAMSGRLAVATFGGGFVGVGVGLRCRMGATSAGPP